MTATNCNNSLKCKYSRFKCCRPSTIAGVMLSNTWSLMLIGLIRNKSQCIFDNENSLKLSSNVCNLVGYEHSPEISIWNPVLVILGHLFYYLWDLRTNFNCYPLKNSLSSCRPLKSRLMFVPIMSAKASVIPLHLTEVHLIT